MFVWLCVFAAQNMPKRHRQHCKAIKAHLSFVKIYSSFFFFFSFVHPSTKQFYKPTNIGHWFLRICCKICRDWSALRISNWPLKVPVKFLELYFHFQLAAIHFTDFGSALELHIQLEFVALPHFVASPHM